MPIDSIEFPADDLRPGRKLERTAALGQAVGLEDAALLAELEQLCG